MLSKRFNSEIEKKWQEKWASERTNAFDTESDKPVYSFDTPPPFTSGSLHLGHVYNHSWIDFVARYKRMKGYNVLLPQGFDCHGLPTELAVEKKKGIKRWETEKFLAGCKEWTDNAITRMKSQFDSMGYSTDWDYSYRTMDEDYKARVQKSLYSFHDKGLLYKAKHPVLWCWKCGTALAKAEVGYIDTAGKLYYIDLDVSGGHKITIATTRPEMMPACVAVFVHPDDARYTSFVGREISLPIFEKKVKIIADKDVDPDFGTGVVYLCTFGDEQDVRWQRKYKLPVIQTIGENGKLSEVAGPFAGLRTKEAREKIVEELEKMGKIRKVEEYPHNVLCHTERSSCNNPIELLPLEQWFIKVSDSTQDILKAARGMRWYPEYMLGRLEDWCESMDWDWIISRQRVWGTPIPFWKCEKCGKIIRADEDELPVDPRCEKRVCECGGDAIGETDVCDCWIDSSLSPLAVSKFEKDNEFFKKTYPVNMRPQGYEIIRTWTFYTIFRNLIMTGKPCFKELMINGMVGGPDGKKMSKSLGNVIEPEEVLKKYSADAIRQWAAVGSPGEDYPFSWDECEHSQKFLTKFWNVSKFVEQHLEDFDIGGAETAELRDTDRWMLAKLDQMVDACNKSFEKYNFNPVIQNIRSFVWHELADYYLEMVKHRLYKPELYGVASRYAAQYTLYKVLETTLRLLAPITPHFSEEVYSELCKGDVLKEAYPESDGKDHKKALEVGEVLTEVIDAVRKYKTDNSLSQGAELEELVLSVPKEKIGFVLALEEDIKGTGRINKLTISEGSTISVA
jgi:valyl-tRNA synthetase